MTADNVFIYGETEVSYLKKRDKRLAEVIERIGPIRREVIPDLFAALVYSIIGQQISTKAHKTIWKKMTDALGEITPAAIDGLSDEELQQFGTTFKKAAYIKSAAQKVLSGQLDIESLRTLSDDEVCAKLVELDGIGNWTAEMLMLFSMQRRDILSFGDLALLRGMRRVYHHKVISRQLFDKYKKRFSPYASVASLYFWAVAAGATEGMKAYKTKKENMETIKITRYHSPVGEMLVGSYGDKLCICDWAVEKRRGTIDRRIQQHLNARYEEGTSEVIERTIGELEAYFCGERKVFDIPLVFTGSVFQCAVWEELMKIPYGAIISYAELARRIHNPKAVRAVAAANATNPISILVPCHRVIGSNHQLTGYGGGLDAKKRLLELERSNTERVG